MSLLRTLGMAKPAFATPSSSATPLRQRSQDERSVASNLGHWFASSLDLQRGLEVTEVVDTLPAELWDQLTSTRR